MLFHLCYFFFKTSLIILGSRSFFCTLVMAALTSIFWAFFKALLYFIYYTSVLDVLPSGTSLLVSYLWELALFSPCMPFLFPVPSRSFMWFSFVHCFILASLRTRATLPRASSHSLKISCIFCFTTLVV